MAKPSYWAGVVIQKPLLNAKKTKQKKLSDGRKDRRMGRGTDGRTDGWTGGWTDRWTDGRTDGRMDGQQTERLRHGTTDIAGYKVACTRLKTGFNPETRSLDLSRVLRHFQK